MSEKILHITDDTFEQEVLQSQTPVLVDYWAEWCGPCKMIAPFLEELAADKGDQVIVAKVNIDDNPMTPTKFGILGIPTLIFFKDGKEVDRMVGVPRKPKEALRDKLEAILAAPVAAA